MGRNTHLGCRLMIFIFLFVRMVVCDDWRHLARDVGTGKVKSKPGVQMCLQVMTTVWEETDRDIRQFIWVMKM